jgi:uncharacterized protein with gpF-like domain
MAELGNRWLKRFDRLSQQLAEYFAKDVKNRSDRDLLRILRKAGFTVKFHVTDGMQNALDATVAANVNLIKSIPQQYLSQVAGSVMRSAQQGGDLHQLVKDIKRIAGVSQRRAALIAHDQTRKATAAMLKVRYQENGITEAVWRHSGAGKEPRPNHLRWGRERKRYVIAKGMWDKDANGKGKGAWIQAGELCNCRCTSSPVIPGLGSAVEQSRWRP